MIERAGPEDPDAGDVDATPDAHREVNQPVDRKVDPVSAAEAAGGPGHEPDPVVSRDSELAAQGMRPDHDRFGLPGRPMSRGNPLYVGFVGGIGVLLAWGLLQVLSRLSQVITLIVIALFLAMGLDPLVRALQRRGLKRSWAVAVVFLAVVAVFIAFFAAVVPPVVSQASALAKAAPDQVQALLRSSLVRRLDSQYGILTKFSEELQKRLSSGETVASLFGGVLGAGKAVLSGFFSAFTVLILTLYFLTSLHTITEACYRLVPSSRRGRVRLLGDEIIRRIGGYVAGQITVASINAFCTFILLKILGLPYGVVLAIVVGLLGLIPLVGATLGAIIVITVALFSSWQDAVIVAIYYVIYQQVENYVIAPRVFARTVAVPGAVALIAALAGATLLGIVGALIAIPIAAGVLLIVKEVLLPRQERL